jgi:hypothetical protein
VGKEIVYRLETYRFLKKYTRFMRSNPRTFPDFYPNRYGRGQWTPPRLAATWKTPKLIGDVSPENDYPGEGAPAYLTPVFSPRAVEQLREFLEPNGELLPVTTPLGTYYAYNVTKLVDALDSPERPDALQRFILKPRTLTGLSIFKVPQAPVDIYVTEPFVRRVRESGLKGMWITKCWPLPKGVRWQDAWDVALQRMKAGNTNEKSRNGPILSSKRARPRRAPKILDLQNDVDVLEGLLKRVMKWMDTQQKRWQVTGEFVSAIGLETTGWDLDDGPGVMCHVDTRECHQTDGHWSYFNVAVVARPRWSALARVLEESDTKRAVIDADGKRHEIRGGDQRIDKWFGGAMVAALKQAREHGVFTGLLKQRKCMLSVEDMDSGFGWRSSIR